MPLYVYECKKCNVRRDVLKGMNDETKEKCPICHKTMKRTIQDSVSAQFKGSGFHVNDYGKK